MQSSIGNKELAWMFDNCFPNTFDTTVDFVIDGRKPDTYIITGDIDACGCGTAPHNLAVPAIFER